VGKNSESRSLALDATLRVFETARRVGFLANAFRSDEKIVGTVADTCYSDCGMNLVYSGHYDSV
jgi:hypothetical protein